MKQLIFFLFSLSSFGLMAQDSLSFIPAAPVKGCNKTTVYFVCHNGDLYDNITWHFGDGDKAYGKSVSHTYSQLGKYTVKLYVEKDGVADSLIKPDFVSINSSPEALFMLEPSTTVGLMKRLFVNESVHHADSFAAYKWEVNEVPVSTNQHLIYEFTAQGVYQVRLTVTNNHGCSDDYTKDIRVKDNDVFPVGVDDQTKRITNVKVYPNPASRILYIENGDSKLEKYTLFDISGKQISSGKENQIDVSELANGTYVIKLDMDTLTMFYKFNKLNQ